MTDTTREDFWRPFGESQWKEFAETVQASDLQLRFSVARFNGASAAAAAKIAGYAGDHDAIRRAGYQAVRSAAVVALLDLAAVNAPTESKLTDAEVDSRLAKLVRSPDPLIMLKATELFDKRKQRAKEAGETPDDDGLTAWRIERDFLLLPNGAIAYVFVHGIANCHLLHDTYSLLMQQEFGPEIWSRFYAKLNDDTRTRLDGLLANPDYQLDVRKKIWAEIDIDITKVDRPQHLRAGMNGH
jgi:hypothetical protein